MHDDLLAQAFVYLAAAVLVVPIAKRLGLGSVLGYLLAGVALGPFLLGLIGHEGQDVMHFAEFGVVMMLFLVGLELKPSLLWSLRRPILGLGGAQVIATALAVAAVALALGQAWRASVAIGLVLAGSSTAIVLQSLNEKGLLRSEGGQATFSVLLFQDIAVIPMLALFPLLAMPGAEQAARAAGDLPAWQQAVRVLAAVVAIVMSGRFVVRPFFRALAKTGLREIFTAAALALVIGITLLMQAVGLSPALGTFLAGVVLAESEYRHELESDIEPFKGLLLGVFFIAVGASIDFRLIASQPLFVASGVLGLIAIKLCVLLVLGWLFGLGRSGQLLLAFGLAQGGEFAFVLFSFAQQSRVLSAATVGPLVAVVALSMAATPLLLLVYERVLLPRLTGVAAEREADAIEAHDGSVVIAGYGRFGQIIGRLLRSSGVTATVLDLDAEIVDVIRRLGQKVYYGDASRLELLRAAGCEHARLLIVAVDDHDKVMEIVQTARRYFPTLPILARARGRVEYYQLRQAGVPTVIRETFGSALMAGTAALRSLGLRAYQAERLTQAFRHHDEAAAQSLEALWGKDKDEKAYFAAARAALQETERLMKQENTRTFGADDGWDNEPLRADVTSRG
jgi:glutathione-regulated potassium-efflux system ancillary protein KefC